MKRIILPSLALMAFGICLVGCAPLYGGGGGEMVSGGYGWTPWGAEEIDWLGQDEWIPVEWEEEEEDQRHRQVWMDDEDEEVDWLGQVDGAPVQAIWEENDQHTGK